MAANDPSESPRRSWQDRVVATDGSVAQLVLRVTLAVVIFPHGLQKTIGWFGGLGFSATMDAFAAAGFPGGLAFAAIAAESLGAFALLIGCLGRVAAPGIGCVMTVAAYTHLPHGFFMNRFGEQAGEGVQFHLLALATATAVVLRGSGAWSVDRLMARHHALVAALPLLCLIGCRPVPPAEEQIMEYLERIDRHDVDGALALVAEDFQLRFGGSAASMSKDDLEKALAWDAAVNSRATHEIVSSSEDSATVLTTERNDFFALIGISALRSLSTFEVNAEGRIEKQRSNVLDGQPSWIDAMKPAVEWCSIHRPDELAAVHDEGRIVFDGASARRWLSLLRAWRKATSIVNKDAS